MKNFSYFVIFLFSLAIVGCGDINEFTPTVVSPDAEWKLVYTNSISDYFTTRLDKPVDFRYSIDETNKKITIFQRVHNDARAILKPNITVTDNGTVIDIVYVESSPGVISGAFVEGSSEFTHNFTYSAKGRGTGAPVLVRVRYEYPKPALGSNSQDLPRYLTF